MTSIHQLRWARISTRREGIDCLNARTRLSSPPLNRRMTVRWRPSRSRRRPHPSKCMVRKLGFSSSLTHRHSQLISAEPCTKNSTRWRSTIRYSSRMEHQYRPLTALSTSSGRQRPWSLVRPRTLTIVQRCKRRNAHRSVSRRTAERRQRCAPPSTSTGA